MKRHQRALLFSLFLLIAGQSYSQLGVIKAVTKPGFTLGVNFDYAMPQGDFKNGFKYGLGGELYGGVGWGKTYLIATVGYQSFTEQNSGLLGKKLTYMPIKAGIKQMFLLKRLFIQADAGVGNVKYAGSSESNFAFGGGAGVRLAGLELGLYYDNFKISGSNAQSLNAKLGWNFTL